MTLADNMETLGVYLTARAEMLGAKEEARRRTCKVGFSIIKKNKAFQKDYMKVGVKKLLCAGIDASKNMGSPCGWDVSHVRSVWLGSGTVGVR